MSKHDRSLSELEPDVVRDFLKAIAPGDPAPQHQEKDYRYGWNHVRAEAARQRIHITKPWIYSTGAKTKLGKHIVSRNALKHGLYSSVLEKSKLESVELSLTSEDGELSKDINDTSKQKNEVQNNSYKPYATILIEIV